MGRYARTRTKSKVDEINLQPLRDRLAKVRSPLEQYNGNPIGFIENFLGESLTYEQKLICDSVLKNRETNVPAAHSIGKCCWTEDWITLADGDRVQFKDLAGKQFKLTTLVDGEIVKVDAIADWNSLKPEPIYKLVTESGHEIYRNINHPVWGLVINNNCKVGWITFAEIGTLMLSKHKIIFCAIKGNTKLESNFLPNEVLSLLPECVPGCHWELVTVFQYFTHGQTVAIEVPKYHTYLTEFYEHNSFLSAKLIIYWVFCVQGLAISTAPTDRQVDKILWGELRRTYDRHKAKLGGVRGVKFLKLNESANAFGFTARDNNSDAFQGIHHANLLIIEDEANGISQEIDDAAKSCASGANNRILRIGNPLTPGSAFNLSCRRSQIRIPVWNHPNVSWAYDANHKLKPEIAELILDEQGTVRSQDDWPSNLPKDIIPGAVSIQWIEEARLNGEESAYWIARVNALFPSDATDGIIPYSWLEKARRRYDENPDKWDELVLDNFWFVGVDVGDGGDNHAITVRRGSVYYFVRTYPTKGDEQDVVRLAGYVIETCKEILKKDWEMLRRFGRVEGDYIEPTGAELLTAINGKIKINVDSIGVGAGTLATLKSNGVRAFSCKVSRASSRPDEFINLNIQIYWQFRLKLQAAVIAVAPLGRIEHQVFEDLAAIKYETTPRGALKCEDKEKARKLLGRSPDGGNSLILCSWEKSVIKADFGVE